MTTDGTKQPEKYRARDSRRNFRKYKVDIALIEQTGISDPGAGIFWPKKAVMSNQKADIF